MHNPGHGQHHALLFSLYADVDDGSASQDRAGAAAGGMSGDFVESI